MKNVNEVTLSYTFLSVPSSLPTLCGLELTTSPPPAEPDEIRTATSFHRKDLWQ